MSPKETLENIYTLDEAAEKIRLKPRTLAKFAQDRGLCSVRGRAILFSEGDLVAIWEAMRVPAKGTFGVSGLPPQTHLSEARLMEKLRKLTAKKPRRRAEL
ncbi:hypothetical protein [Phyllobacterium sp. P5_D12]